MNVFLFGLVLLALPTAGHAQQAVQPVERVYNHSRVEVEKGLQAMQAYATSRLPVLDGFVNANASTLDHFENPHFQFRIELKAEGPAQTVVQIAAKITAWYAGAASDHSQYVVVPSNGRLEEDLLDRLSIYLEKGSSRQPAGAGARAPLSDGAGLGPSPGAANGPQTGAAGKSSAILTDPGTPAATSTGTDAATLASQIAAVQAQREATEQNVRRLRQQTSELEANSKSQKFLSNLATVKATRTPIFQQADESSKILFRADPEDEFEIIDAHEGWVHVRLENTDEGWLRISQLQRPNEVDDSGDMAVLNFLTPSEEIKPFVGEWMPLKGKPALFVFANPARELPAGTLGQSQLDFAKHVFTDGYREATHSDQAISGVVVVFLGAKGGVAAATLADIRRWHDGTLSDKLFLERCSLDPPESFRDVPKRPRQSRGQHRICNSLGVFP
jgi:hypothetical protein